MDIRGRLQHLTDIGRDEEELEHHFHLALGVHTDPAQQACQ